VNQNAAPERPDLSSALVQAIDNNLPDVVDVLLRFGADMNDESSSPFFPPLKHALCDSCVDCLKVLIRHGLQPNRRLRWTTQDERFGKHHDNIIVQVASTTNPVALRLLLEHATYANLTERDEILAEALVDSLCMCMTGERKTECVDILLKYGADMYANDAEAVRLVTRSTTRHCHNRLLQVFLKHGLNPDFDKGYMMWWSVYEGNIESMRILVDNGADVHSKHGTLRTFLDESLDRFNHCGKAEHARMCRMLFETGVKCSEEKQETLRCLVSHV
jgi:hypothetical protein